MRLSAALIAILGAAALTEPLSASERIAIETGELTMPGMLYRPSGNGPFPAIVALHGCEGLLYQSGTVRPHYQDWGDRLVASGFVVLFPDSLAARGLGSQCRVHQRAVRSNRERASDVRAAKHWLQRQSYVNSSRVSLLGWSNGAITALWAVRPRAEPKDEGPDFRSATAFYPECRRLGETGWSARIPTLILMGTADDWTPVRDCEQMVAGARGRSAGTTIVKYRGAHHYFDRPDLPLQERTGYAFTPDGSGRIHVGSDATARVDAIKRVSEWLAR